MSCIICEDVELEVPRCPQCGRLPNDTQLAILTEAYDCIDVVDKIPSSTIQPEIIRAIKVLTGVVRHLVIENKNLKREVTTLRDGLN